VAQSLKIPSITSWKLLLLTILYQNVQDKSLSRDADLDQMFFDCMFSVAANGKDSWEKLLFLKYRNAFI
jgi:hypothetical protein